MKTILFPTCFRDLHTQTLTISGAKWRKAIFMDAITLTLLVTLLVKKGNACLTTKAVGTKANQNKAKLTEISQFDTQDHVQTRQTSSQMGMAYFDGLVQDCSISSALAMEILQSCTKPSI